ncbi:MAG TPA: tetratricopeptide repeat protein [Pirellulaceae bacterium]|nr:tetratricopeptide repeat protein [Pirellulaceae bacterium]HMO91157.1 tetratricopeptide repeat protein [Pirellulaceae bacterium]HMP69073.1 tetratricopeptide repeat protein [Pirellulaceae bacterium]
MLSHSGLDDEGRANPRGSQAVDELNKMLAEGRSFSGRERNCVFLNTLGSPAADNRFATISAVSNLDLVDDSRAIAVVDWNHDGYPDLIVSGRTAPRLRILINQFGLRTSPEPLERIANAGNFVSILLQGNGQTTNRDAIGARVEVLTAESAGQRLRNVQTLRAGEGFLSQSSKTLTFGLGNDVDIQKILVYWPGKNSSSPEVFEVSEINRTYRLVQGSGRIEYVPSTVNRTLVAGNPQGHPRTSDARIKFQLQLPAPPIRYLDFSPAKQTYRLANKPVLLLLWSSDCHTCLRTLGNIREHFSQFENVGLDVLALSMDALNPTGSVNNAATRAQQGNWPFTAGLATEAFVDALQEVYNHAMPLHSPLPIPSSFLINEHGRVVAIYKGEFGIDEVFTDLFDSRLDSIQRFEKSAARAGRILDHPVTNDALQRQEAAAKSMYANYLLGTGQRHVAIKEYRDILRFRPNYLAGYYAVANELRNDNRHAEAIRFLKEGLQHVPNDPKLHSMIGDLYLKTLNLDNAAEHFRIAAQYGADSAEHQFNYGNVMLVKNDLETAKRHLEEAIRLKPNFADAYHDLGNIAFKKGEFEAAENHYSQALAIQAEFPEALCNLGNLYASRGQFQKAVRKYNDCLKLKPDYREAIIALDRIAKLGKR